MEASVQGCLVAGVLAVDLDGFADTFGEMSAPGGWNALATVSPVLMDNLGRHELADLMRAKASFKLQESWLVWVRMDENGTVWAHEYVPTDSPQEQGLIQRFEAEQAAYAPAE